MASNECAIVQDLLPLYAEKIASEETQKFVEEHLTGCQDCRNVLEDMTAETTPPVQLDAAPLKKLRKKMTWQRVRMAAFVAIIVAVLGVGVGGYLTAAVSLPYSPDTVRVYEEDGIVNVCDTDSRSFWLQIHAEPSSAASTVYYISAMTSVWARFTHDYPSACGPFLQNVGTSRPSAQDTTVYYFTSPTETVLLYGDPVTGGAFRLQGLPLGYGLLIAALLSAVVGAAAFLVRKKTAIKVWLERILLIPASYCVAHLCVMGTSTVSYTIQRDLSLIVIIATVVYLLALLGLNLYRGRKDHSYAMSS